MFTSADFTEQALRQFQKRLALVIVAKGGHIERFFD